MSEATTTRTRRRRDPYRDVYDVSSPEVRQQRKIDQMRQKLLMLMQTLPGQKDYWRNRLEQLEQWENRQAEQRSKELAAEVAPEVEAEKAATAQREHVKGVIEKQPWYEHVGRQLAKGAYETAKNLSTGLARFIIGPMDIEPEQLASVMFQSGLSKDAPAGPLPIQPQKLYETIEERFREAKWQPLPVEGAGELLKNPKALAGRVANAAPYMLGMVGMTAGTGGAGAIGMAYLVESENAYKSAKEHGASEGKARLAGLVIGSINAVIEFIQAKQILALTKGGQKLLTRRAGKTALARLMKQGLKKTLAGKVKAGVMKTVRTAVHEAVEEMAQGITEEEGAKWIYDKEVEPGWIDRRLQEAIVAGALTLATGGALRGAEVGIEKAGQYEPSMLPPGMMGFAEGGRGPGVPDGQEAVTPAPQPEQPAEAPPVTPPAKLMQSGEHAPRKIVEAYKAGRIELTVTHKALAKVVRRDIPKSKQGNYINRIASAQTQAQVSKVANDITQDARRYAVQKATEGETEVIMSEVRYLEEQTKKFRQGVRKGEIKGGRGMVTHQKELAVYAKQRGVPSWALGRIVPHLKARTDAELTRAVEAVDRIAEASRKREELKRYYDQRSKLKIDDLDPGVQDEAYALLSDITDKTSIKKAAETLAELEDVLVQGYVREKVEIPQSVAKAFKVAAAEIEKKSVHEMTSGELFQLNEAIKAIVEQAKHAKQVWNGEKWADRGAVKKDIIENVKTRWGTKYAAEEGVEGEAAARGLLERFRKFETTDRVSYDVQTEALFGQTSEARRLLYDRLQVGERQRHRIEIDAAEELQAFLKTHGLTGKLSYSRFFGRLSKKITVEATTGEKMTAHPRTFVSMLMQLMDDETGPRIVTGKNPIILPGRKTKATNRSTRFYLELPSLVPAKLKAMAEDWMALWNGRISDIANEASVRIDGHRLSPEDRTYIHRPTKPISQITPEDLMPETAFGKPGFTKKRIEHGRGIRILDPMRMWHTHVQGVANYAGKYHIAETARQLLINDPDVAATMDDALKRSEDWRENIRAALDAYYSRQVVRPVTGVRAIQALIRNIHRSLLVPIHISVYQPLSWAMAAHAQPILARPDILAKALVMLANPKEVARMVQWFHEHSPVMYSRLQSSAHEIMTAGSSTQRAEVWARGKRQVRDILLAPIHIADSGTILMIHFGLKASGVTGDALVRAGEEIVEQTQPTWDALTVSHRTIAKRKSPVIALIDIFNSQRSKNVNILAREALRATTGFRAGNRAAGMRALGRLIRAGVLLYLISAFIPKIRRKARELERGRLSVIEKVESQTWYHTLVEGAKTMVENFTGIGNLAVRVSDAIEAGIKRKWKLPERLDIINATIGQILNATKLFAEAGTGGGKRVKSGRYKGMKRRNVQFWIATKELTGAVGKVFGIPIETAWRYAHRWLPTTKPKPWGGSGGIKAQLKRRGLSAAQRRKYRIEALRQKGTPDALRYADYLESQEPK